jgi:formiminoglutamase
MSIDIFFSRLDPAALEFDQAPAGKSWKNFTELHLNNFPDLDGLHLAIIGIEELSGKHGSPANEIRRHLYRLLKNTPELKIADLGNIKQGEDKNDTLFALKTSIAYLLGRKIVPIIIGAGTDLCFAQYTAYEGISENVNMVSAASRLELHESDEQTSYLKDIIEHEPNFLFNLSHMGHQSYFVDQESIEAMEKMYFDVIRLGHLRAAMDEAETLLRNADLLMFEINSIKQSDAPAQDDPSPNGLAGDEACQIARYAGISNQISSFGIYGINSRHDRQQQTAKLVSQMIWYFVEGFYSRRNDLPAHNSPDFIKYRTTFQKSEYEIVFFKSKKTDRWWMEVPHPKEKGNKRPFLVPCSYVDYQTACNDEMPDRWWRAYQKLI